MRFLLVHHLTIFVIQMVNSILHICKKCLVIQMREFLTAPPICVKTFSMHIKYNNNCNIFVLVVKILGKKQFEDGKNKHWGGENKHWGGEKKKRENKPRPQRSK